jgi:D-sedoheptulose 7-phosphate isomerase
MISSLEQASLYFAELQEAVARLPVKKIDTVISILLESARVGKKVFICGNGGSASTASHFACDLAKNTIIADAPWLRVVGLTDNIPLMTAWANDTGYDNVFAAQLVPLVEAGDVVIGISCSGNSPNVLNAIAAARQRGATTIAFTGDRGGQLIELADLSIQVSNPRIEIQEDVHLALGHCITRAVRTALQGQIDRATAEVTWILPQSKVGLSPRNGNGQP